MRLLLLLVIYVLSFGPVQALYTSERLQGPIPAGLLALYEPVAWLRAHTPLSQPLAAYEAWWQRLLQRS